MIDEVRIAYGFKRSDRDFREHNVDLDRVFIDNPATEKEELRAVLAAVRPGVTVVVLQTGDFGPGAKATQVCREIESRGGKVEVPEKVVGVRGRKPKGVMSAKDERWARGLWLDPALTKSHVLKRIQKRTGITFTRDQLNYRFIGKQRRAAKKPKR